MTCRGTQYNFILYSELWLINAWCIENLTELISSQCFNIPHMKKRDSWFLSKDTGQWLAYLKCHPSLLKMWPFHMCFFKHFASKNQWLVCLNGTLAGNGLMPVSKTFH